MFLVMRFGLLILLFVSLGWGCKRQRTTEGEVKDGCVEVVWYRDSDNDLYSDGTSQVSCHGIDGYKRREELVSLYGDCNDNLASVNPKAAPNCNDTLDNDCSGQVERWAYVDFDGDRYAPSNVSVCVDIVNYPGRITVGSELGVSDCDDSLAYVYPGAPLNCNNGLDNDCSGRVERWAYTDADGDRYAPSNVSECVDVVIYPGRIIVGSELGVSDCDDSLAYVYPGAPLNCNNGLDNDCSGRVERWAYTDADGDRYAPSNVSECVDVVIYPGRITAGNQLGLNDCNNSNSSVNPGIVDLCDGIDNDCDLRIDEDQAPCAAPTNLTYFFISTNTVGLRWSDNSPNEEGFVVEVSTDASFLNPRTDRFPANTTEAYITSLFGGITYHFRVYAFNTTGHTSYSNVISVTTTVYFEGAIQIDLGSSHTCAVKVGGSLWCWGANWAGQLGDGTHHTKYAPIPITTEVKQVSLGSGHTCAVKTDGSLLCCGSNLFGQLGDGTSSSSNLPVQITTGVKQVSLGDLHTCAVKVDGSLWCWGYNVNGQVGDGTNTDRETPMRVMKGVSQVSLGGYHTCAVKVDGSLWCWGSNQSGQLGDGTTSDRLYPTRVSSERSSTGPAPLIRYLSSEEPDVDHRTHDKIGCSSIGVVSYLIFALIFILFRKRKLNSSFMRCLICVVGLWSFV